jgi:hypothetical protein
MVMSRRLNKQSKEDKRLFSYFGLKPFVDPVKENAGWILHTENILCWSVNSSYFELSVPGRWFPIGWNAN